MENNETKINEEMRELTDEELAQVSGGRIDLPVSGGGAPTFDFELVIVPSGGGFRSPLDE